jgi:hypothetical protein
VVFGLLQGLCKTVALPACENVLVTNDSRRNRLIEMFHILR